MSLSVAEKFFIEHHRHLPPKEIAETLGVTVRKVQNALNRLPENTEAGSEVAQLKLHISNLEGVIKKLSSPNQSENVGLFSVQSGTTSMTPAQAKADDEFLRNRKKTFKGGKGIIIINPDKPVR